MKDWKGRRSIQAYLASLLNTTHGHSALTNDEGSEPVSEGWSLGIAFG